MFHCKTILVFTTKYIISLREKRSVCGRRHTVWGDEMNFCFLLQDWASACLQSTLHLPNIAYLDIFVSWICSLTNSVKVTSKLSQTSR